MSVLAFVTKHQHNKDVERKINNSVSFVKYTKHHRILIFCFYPNRDV